MAGVDGMAAVPSATAMRELEARLLIPGDRFRRDGMLWQATRIEHTHGEPVGIEAVLIAVGKPATPKTMQIDPSEIVRLG